MRVKLLLIVVAVTAFAVMAFADYPSCNYSDAYCIWGHVWDQTYPNQSWPIPICSAGACYGPVDLCYGWDSTCSTHLYTVCQLHKDDNDNSAFYFTLPVSGSWLTKARTPWGNRAQYSPYTHSYAAYSVSAGTVIGALNTDFYLINGSPAGTSSCP